MQHLMQPDDVWMIEHLEKADLACETPRLRCVDEAMAVEALDSEELAIGALRQLHLRRANAGGTWQCQRAGHPTRTDIPAEGAKGKGEP